MAVNPFVEQIDDTCDGLQLKLQLVTYKTKKIVNLELVNAVFNYGITTAGN